MTDKLNFGKTEITKLFFQILIPTLMGMVFSAAFVITDGIFVGQGIGSDAIAAVNITAPIFLINTGFGLMFGVGSSVIASIYLSRGQIDNARLNITHSIVICISFLAVIWTFVTIFAPEVAILLGSSERLLPLVVEYIYWFVPFLVFSAILSAGLFYIRLDGAPNFAMMCNVISAVINIILDYLFIYVFEWGMFGAALATSLGYIVGAAMVLIYMSRKSCKLRFIAFDLTQRSRALISRNIKNICKLGSSTFLCELAIACMMFVGNAIFMKYLHEDGVAAFSVGCYLFPLILMLNTAIGQSAQPIISYNYGAGNMQRVKKALNIAMTSAILSAIVIILIQFFFSGEMVAMFIDEDNPAYTIASKGLPLFALGYIFFAINIVAISYFQSIERATPATVITVLRGFIFMIPCFIILPIFWGDKGMWLAVPVTELITTLYVFFIFLKTRRKSSYDKI